MHMITLYRLWGGSHAPRQRRSSACQPGEGFCWRPDRVEPPEQVPHNLQQGKAFLRCELCAGCSGCSRQNLRWCGGASFFTATKLGPFWGAFAETIPYRYAGEKCNDKPERAMQEPGGDLVNDGTEFIHDDVIPRRWRMPT